MVSDFLTKHDRERLERYLRISRSQARSFGASVLFLAMQVASSLSATVYVANENDASVSVIDSVSGTTKTIDLPIAPHNVDITLDGMHLLATGLAKDVEHRTHKAATNGQLIIVGLMNHGLELNSVPIGGHPAHVVPDREGRLAYVTDSANNAVIIVDLPARKVVGRVAVGVYPHGLRMSSDGRLLAVANTRSGNVSLIDVETRKVLATVPVGKSPVQVAFDPAGKFLAVSLNGEDKVSLLDLPARKVLWKAEVGRGPVQVSFTLDGKTVFVANQGSAANPDNRVSLLSVAEKKSVQSITVGKGAHGTAVTNDGKAIFVTNTYANTLSQIDLGTMRVTATHPTGRSPNGIVVHQKADEGL